MRFIRIHGRVVPIKNKNNSAKKKKDIPFNKKAALIGGIVGAVGAAIAIKRHDKKTFIKTSQASASAFWNQTPGVNGEMSLFPLLSKRKK